jgi:hypothetical protein
MGLSKKPKTKGQRRKSNAFSPLAFPICYKGRMGMEAASKLDEGSSANLFATKQRSDATPFHVSKLT